MLMPRWLPSAIGRCHAIFDVTLDATPLRDAADTTLLIAAATQPPKS